MKQSKDSVRIARRLFALCIENGQLNEQKLHNIFMLLKDKKPRNLAAILMSLVKNIRLHQESQSVLVKSAVELDPSLKQILQNTINQKYTSSFTFIYQTDHSLLGGLCIQIGDNVWDASLKKRLERLTA